MQTDKLFTGQRDTGLGIYDYAARFRAAPPRRSRAGYSPKLGRFLSPDTIVPGYANPQNLNRFSYVRNNPLRYIDPTGHKPCGDGEVYNCDGTLNTKTPPNPLPPPPSGGCGTPGQPSCGGNGGGGGSGGSTGGTTDSGGIYESDRPWAALSHAL